MSNMPSSAAETAIRFLKRVYPDGPWCLSAIAPDRKGMETRTFWPGDPVPDVDYDTSEEGCRAWLLGWYGKRNLYWHVNPVMHLLEKKAERTDIKQVCFLQVDIDPQNDTAIQPLKQQQEALLLSLTKKLPEGVPAPTIIIFSGGGYQAFWKLQEPLHIDGDLARAEDAKRYNKWLEQMLGGDNCHNIDRLMRLPGTLNIPDEKKKAKGREPVEASVVEHNDNAYPITAFKQAAVITSPLGKAAKPKGQVVAVNVENVRRIEDLSELDEWNIPDRVKVIIAQGKHPEQPKAGDNSRSAWLFDAVCQLVRAEVPDVIIYSLITDPGWAISASVLELKAQAHRYAVKQIASAKEHAVDPDLARFNDRYFVVQVANKVLVGEFIRTFTRLDSKDQPVFREELAFITLPEFQNLYEAEKVCIGNDKDGNPKYTEAGKWWRKNPKRRQYGRLVFRPDVASETIEQPGRHDDLNLWTGFTVEPGTGNRHDLFIAFLRDIICDQDPVKFNYLWRWIALKVQNPGMVMQVAIALIGGKGVGKTFFAEVLESLFGRHALIVDSQDQFVGKFNALLRDCCLIVSDEAYYPHDKKHQSVLKTRITSPTMIIEPKGIDAERVNNHLGVILLSNDVHVVPASDDERRYFVARVSDARKQDKPYFKELADAMDNGGLEDLLGALRREDLSAFNVRDMPKTAELHEQVIHTNESSPLAERIEEVLSPFELWGCAFRFTDLMNVLGYGTKYTRQDANDVKAILQHRGYRYGTYEPHVWDDGKFLRMQQKKGWYMPDLPRLELEADKPGVDDNWLIVGGFRYADATFVAEAEARVKWMMDRLEAAANPDREPIRLVVSDGKPTVK